MKKLTALFLAILMVFVVAGCKNATEVADKAVDVANKAMDVADQALDKAAEELEATPEPTVEPTPEPTPEPVLSTADLYVGTYHATKLDENGDITIVPEGETYTFTVYADGTADMDGNDASEHIDLNWYDKGDGTISVYQGSDATANEVIATLNGTSLVMGRDGVNMYFEKAN